jgi:hypothetical protein
MIQVEELKELLNLSAEQISLPFTLLNLILCLTVSMIIRSYYINYSNSLTGKLHLGQIIPILSSVVFLVIVIVKSSLALSLGLVGALSIVRFRTPIKEPEELVYLFLSISVGLGFGAGYPLITSIIVLLILVFNYFFLRQNKTIKTNEYNLIIEIQDKELKFDDLIEKISVFCDTIKFIRVDSDKKNHTVVLLISIKRDSSADNILKQFQNNNTNVSLFESKTNW